VRIGGWRVARQGHQSSQRWCSGDVSDGLKDFIPRRLTLTESITEAMVFIWVLLQNRQLLCGIKGTLVDAVVVVLVARYNNPVEILLPVVMFRVFIE